MTVSTAYSPLSFAGNGSTTAFSVTWPFFTGSLVVTLIDSSGVETVKSLTTHYTVSGGTDANGLPATGTVTMLAAPASGETLRVTRSTPKTQAATWAESDAFPQKVVESALDRLTLMVQEGTDLASVYDGIQGDVLSLVTSGATDYWDAQSKILRNLADATGSTDAMPYGQFQTELLTAGSGNVVGPASSVDGRPVLFDQTTGKLIKQGFDLAAGCSVTKSGTQSIPNTTYTTVTFDTENFDTENIHSIVSNTSRLTVPSGVSWVRLSAQIGWAINNSGGRIISIYKNGVVTTVGFQLYLAFSESYQSVITPYLAVTPGDYFELLVYQSSGGSLNLAAGTTFSMEIVK